MKAAVAVLLLAGAAAPLQAQWPGRLELSAGGASTRVRAATTGGTGILTGVTAGGTARLVGRVGLELAYRQGSLSVDSGAASARELVEGRALVAVRPVSWLVVLAGAHAIALDGPAGTERWLLWEGRLRAEGTLLAPSLRSHVELWTGFGGSVNVGTGSPTARGGEAALTWHLPRSPAWARVGYAIEHAEQPGGANARTVEHFNISVGLGGR